MKFYCFYRSLSKCHINEEETANPEIETSKISLKITNMLLNGL